MYSLIRPKFSCRHRASVCKRGAATLDRCWLRFKQSTAAVGAQRPIRRQRGAGLGSDWSRRSAGRLAGHKSQ